MRKTVAVDASLENISELLDGEGYNVVGAADYQGADVVVVAGMNNNVMNMQETKTSVPVIDASGKSEREILAEINNSF